MGSAHQPLRLVLDTNIVVAGLLRNGPPLRLVELSIERKAFQLFSSPVQLEELVHTLGYSKFAAAVAAGAHLIITGDGRHLLPNGLHQGIAIVTAREVLDRIEARSRT